MARLKKERTAAGLTQVQLSKLSGVKQSTISMLEGTNRRTRPSFDTLAKLAAALNRSGRNVSAGDLNPTTQPRLVRGARAQAHAAKRGRNGGAMTRHTGKVAQSRFAGKGHAS